MDDTVPSNSENNERFIDHILLMLICISQMFTNITVATWATINAYTPPEAPSRFRELVIDCPIEPANTPDR